MSRKVSKVPQGRAIRLFSAELFGGGKTSLRGSHSLRTGCTAALCALALSGFFAPTALAVDTLAGGDVNHPSVQSDDEYNFTGDLGNVNVDIGALTLNNTSGGDRKIQEITVHPDSILRLTGSNTIETSLLTVDGTLERTDGVLLIKKNDANFKFEVNENGKLELSGSSVLRFQTSQGAGERLTGKLDGVINASTVEFYDSASL